MTGGRAMCKDITSHSRTPSGRAVSWSGSMGRSRGRGRGRAESKRCGYGCR